MTPTPRAAALLAGLAVASLLVGPVLAGLAALALLAAIAVDVRSVRRPPAIDRQVSRVIARGVPASFELRAETADRGRTVRVRQATPADVRIEPEAATGELRATLTGERRGRHSLPGVASVSLGPLGLARRHHAAGPPRELLVYPDLPTARRLALLVRRGALVGGQAARGPLGLGTEFESVRDYLPDDDVRQLNWRASARLGRPMSNQYRIEQDREVICLVDSGRLMGTPLGDRTRLDAALDALTAVGLVADELGDRCGAVAFDSGVRVELRPRRGGGRVVVRGLFDLEPTTRDSDFELAFTRVGAARRAMVLVFTDLVDLAAARSLLAAAPLLTRRHAVAIVSVEDPDLRRAATQVPQDPAQAYETLAAVDVLEARLAVCAQLRRRGAQVVEAPVEQLALRCVQAYLSAKARARL
ncbi:MAG TPA: DUF58 domain-containing protein [Solirubrobacteraceae bacterium]|jgi:uncharacterized protein (DUF58 family)|nr:DUF58 domain-containing protein [Solirubrobacteraceae bacterium]